LAFMRTLSPSQQQQATIGVDLPSEAAGFMDNEVIPYVGIRYRDFSSAQQDGLLALVGRYLGRMRAEYAASRLNELREHLSETYFAWAGGSSDDSIFYYRVHSPVILLEFEHQAG